ncbi:hypothetical protein ABZT03_00545 [Streptomyces sp. NPDC005574]|uniref:hypothetical protein n=1 Tax=Streptomyces sp. NPDC005574 TaxID=3156891 RepID=UPI0033B26DCD
MSLTGVVLSSGRPVELRELRLSSTYGGLPDGYPCRPVNDLRVTDLLATARRAFPLSPVHLVPPARERPDQYAGALGPVELLPPVACVGAFRSAPVDPAHDPDLYRSSLTVVWFQPTPHVPTACDADVALRGIPWEELAEDYAL